MSGKEKDIAILRCPFVWDESSLLRHIEALDVEQFAVGDACLGVAAGKDGSVALECNEVGEGYGGFALSRSEESISLKSAERGRVTLPTGW